VVPDGFVHRPAFLSPAEEAGLRSLLATLPLEPFVIRGFVAKRRVTHFGAGYAYDDREVGPAPPLPPFLAALRPRAAALAGVGAGDLAMASAMVYPPGAGIGWHRDAPAFGVVVGISLGGPARFILRRGGAGGEKHEVVLAPGDAYLVAGAARWEWQHHVPPVRAERWVVTYRTLRGKGRPHDR
jgi:DNA oxidative demethylase